jgi:hypothetical protein
MSPNQTLGDLCLTRDVSGILPKFHFNSFWYFASANLDQSFEQNMSRQTKVVVLPGSRFGTLCIAPFLQHKLAVERKTLVHASFLVKISHIRMV